MASTNGDSSLALAKGEEVGLWPLIYAYIGWGRSSLYDFCIVHVTSTWYEAMLEELDEGSVVLDVGIGTATALVKHRAILQKKNIRVIGIDSDAAYIEAARFHIGAASIENCVRVYHQDVYSMSELNGQIVLPHGNQVGFHSQKDDFKFDAILFSGTFAVLPKKIEAITMLLDEWGNPDACKVMIAQAYQRAISPLARIFKPLLKYLTTVDHGDLITEHESSKMIDKISRNCNLKLIQHELIDGSIDNALEAAYLTIFERDTKK